MNTGNKISKEKLDIFLDNFIKVENESCFLQHNGQIEYNAVILLEMFYIEEFDNLFDSLDIIYSEVLAECLNVSYSNPRLDYRKLDSRKIFYDKGSSYLFLPSILNSRFGTLSINNACYDLGSDIKELFLTVYTSLPSIIVLQIQANLVSDVSERINNIIHKYHKGTEIISTEEGKITKNCSSCNSKNLDINEIKNKVKKEIVDFISVFFEGYFIKKSKKCFSIIPCIDIYSLTYPNKLEYISKWLLNNISFFECFNILTYNTGYIYKQYLFLENHTLQEPFNNYSLLINCKFTDQTGYYNYNVESSIGYLPSMVSFDLLCIYRWVDFTGRNIRNFNESTIKELGDFTQTELKNLISNRQKITKELFYFERFKIEFEDYNSEFFRKGIDFILLNKNMSLFNRFLNKIKEEIASMDATTNVLNKHSINNLSLKNIEYNKKMQDKVVYLTNMVIFFAIIQIILAMIQILDQSTLYSLLISTFIFILIILTVFFLNNL